MDKEAEDAFGCLVRKYERKVLAFFLSKNCDSEDAREFTQRSFLRVFRGIERIDRSFEGFLFVTAWNVYKNDLRRSSTQMRKGTEISTDDVEGKDLRHLVSSGDVLRQLVKKDEEVHLLRRLQVAIDAMPPRRRQCFKLHRQGLRDGDIAEALGISKGSVKVHLFKARQDLRSSLRSSSESDR